MTPQHVMIVEDAEDLAAFVSRIVEARGARSSTYRTAEEALAACEHEVPAVVILDLLLPGAMDGLTALAAFKKLDRDLPVLIISGQGRTSVVVQAMKLGAADFVAKPFTEAELAAPLGGALRHREVSREIASLRQELVGEPRATLLIGGSPRMREIRELIDRVADTDVTVLVRGESGTGKEIVARAVHAASQRRDKPFVKVNCAALPSELLESELFGFERGAFTGAIQHKPGKFEFANRGTMFLDEVSEMSPALQAKLLQVLQDGEFSRLGGKADVRVDVRMVAATNQNLEKAVAEGRFREDLFFRLDVVSIELPPLRERRDEIPALAQFFLKKYAVQYNKPAADLSRETLQAFREHDWPGNVRELENVIKRLVVLGSDAAIQKELRHATELRQRAAAPLSAPRGAHAPDRRSAAAVPTGAVNGTAAAAAPSGAPGTNGWHGRAPNGATPVSVQPPAGTPAAQPPVGPAAVLPAAGQPDATAILEGQCSLKEVSRNAAREAERALILRMLQHTRWNRKEAAEHLGISYKALLYKIKENGLDKAS